MCKRYFLTVDWCSQGRRGIFCDAKGNAFPKDGEPHNEDDFRHILDCFSLILAPQSQEFTEAEIAQYHRWVPLAEFSNQYGIVLKSQP